MKTLMRMIGAVLAAIAMTGGAFAQERGDRDGARAMVDAAVEHIQKVGPEQAFKDFTDKANTTWHKKDLYVFAYNLEGLNVGHGANDKLIGKNLIDMRDPNGKFLIRELRDMAVKGGGWVEYEWPHPHTRKIEAKASYVRRTVNFDGFVGVGVYR
jgi:signal transduction histidine kinase